MPTRSTPCEPWPEPPGPTSPRPRSSGHQLPIRQLPALRMLRMAAPDCPSEPPAPEPRRTRVLPPGMPSDIRQKTAFESAAILFGGYTAWALRRVHRYEEATRAGAAVSGEGGPHRRQASGPAYAGGSRRRSSMKSRACQHRGAPGEDPSSVGRVGVHLQGSSRSRQASNRRTLPPLFRHGSTGTGSQHAQKPAWTSPKHPLLGLCPVPCAARQHPHPNESE